MPLLSHWAMIVLLIFLCISSEGHLTLSSMLRSFLNNYDHENTDFSRASTASNQFTEITRAPNGPGSNKFPAIAPTVLAGVPSYGKAGSSNTSINITSGGLSSNLTPSVTTEAIPVTIKSGNSTVTSLNITSTSSHISPSSGNSTATNTTALSITLSSDTELTTTVIPALTTSMDASPSTEISTVSTSFGQQSGTSVSTSATRSSASNPIVTTPSGPLSEVSVSSEKTSPAAASTPTTSTSQIGETAMTASPTSSAIESSTKAPDLTMYTNFPPVSTGEVPSVTTDGHIETTGSDHKPARVSVLNPHCFFCPPAIEFGVALFGLLPGIYPPGPPPLPGFKSPFPALTIGNNGDPTYSSPTPTDQITPSSEADSTKSNSSPNTETDLSSTTDDTRSVVHQQSINLILKLQGHNNGFVMLTTQSCPTFRPLHYVEPDDDGIEPIPGTSEETLATAKRWRRRTSLTKRASSRRINFSRENPKCLVVDEVKTLTVPDPGNLPGFPAAKYWFVTAKASANNRTYIGTYNGTHHGTYNGTYSGTHDSGYDGEYNGTYYNATDNGPYRGTYRGTYNVSACGPWRMNKAPSAVNENMKDAFGKMYVDANRKKQTPEFLRTHSFVNVDHAFEIKSFWNQHNDGSKGVAKGKGERGSFYYVLGGRDGWTRLQTITALLPGTWAPFADFIGTDDTLNTWKGEIFQTAEQLTVEKMKVKHLQDSDLPSDWIDLLTYVAGALQLVHHPDVVEAFQNTKNRLYLAFKEIDKINDACRVETYADKFKRYMDGRLEQQKPRIEGFYREIISERIKPNELGADDPIKVKWEIFNAVYPESYFTLHYESMLPWEEKNAAQTVQINKREDSDAGCRLSSTATRQDSSSISISTGISASSRSSPDTAPVSSISMTATSSQSQMRAPSSIRMLRCMRPRKMQITPRQRINPGPDRLRLLLYAPALPLPGISPDCNDGFYDTQQECTDNCDDGECKPTPGMGSDEVKIVQNCYCEPPLPSPTPKPEPPPAPAPKCESGRRSSARACRNTCPGGECERYSGDTDIAWYGYTCNCGGWLDLWGLSLDSGIGNVTFGNVSAHDDFF
ncbi:hypothetical protein EPUS_00475 [Endocarpon pusillum Z07020]|uniref:Uncharacterized protein n=1 Tax=Endocarpon pusillum (strain Z07020 / HMAS-L-300199) TaxID=1263415 RepID=U1GI50_ENDPU|nr:uncharacterized protein EPUS_00475 [Endocarpon pusillum Z07020]ERF71486.1 hypothetical protein EPUS_00475 [Endocarpon pusillum Z07020]